MTRFRIKITGGLLLIIVLLLLFLGVYTGKLLENTYMETLSERLEKEAFIIAKSLNWNPTETTIDDAIDQQVKSWAQAADARITLIDTKGVVLSDSQVPHEQMENHLNREEVQKALLKGVGHSRRASSTTGQDMLYIAVPIQNDGEVVGAVRFSYPIKAIQSKVYKLWFGQLLGLLVALALSVMLGNRVVRKLTRPIEEIIEVALEITKQRFGKKVNVEGKGEIADLAQAINYMSKSLEYQLRQIKENEKRLSDILRSMESGVLLVDRDGKIMIANLGITKILGVNEREIVGMYHHDTTHNFGLSRLIDQVLTHQNKVHDEIHIYYPKEKIVDVNVVPHFSEDNQLLGVVLVLHDITHIRQLEKIRSDFVANVSHELRTPVTSIRGFAETLLDGAMEDKETLQSFLEIIYKESERLQRLINDILDLSKIEQKWLPLDYKVCSLAEVVHEVIRYLTPEIEKKGIRVEENIASDMVLEADLDRLKQILINLVINSIQYTPEQGNITVEAQQCAEQVTIVVADSGIGIPKSDLPRIFERFYRVDKARPRNSGGTGIGLSIVRHLVESHGGKIWADSEEGIGTRFYIQLPIHQSKQDE